MGVSVGVEVGEGSGVGVGVAVAVLLPVAVGVAVQGLTLAWHSCWVSVTSLISVRVAIALSTAQPRYGGGLSRQKHSPTHSVLPKSGDSLRTFCRVGPSSTGYGRWISHVSKGTEHL